MSSPNSPLPMDKEGPPLEILLHRIAEIPDDFLAATDANKRNGNVVVPAVVFDVAESLGVTFTADDLAGFAPTDAKADAARTSLTLLLCWLLAAEWFRSIRAPGPLLLELLRDVAAELAQHGAAPKYLKDPDRREELGRLVLAHFGYRPAGETKAQAQDRLNSLSIVERARVLRASRQAEERARAIRAALVKKAADEAADKWTRE